MDKEELIQQQNLTLKEKIKLSSQYIEEWYEHWEGQVYVSFSGGKDSTVLLHLIRQIYSDIPAVFCDTGLEYPEIREFVKTIDNVIWLKPKKNFKTLFQDYGYPIISKDVTQKIYEINNGRPDVVKLRLDGIKKDGTYSPISKLPLKWRFLLNAPFKVSNRCCYYLKKAPFYKYERETKRKPFIGTMANESVLRFTTCLKNGHNNYNTKRPVSTPISFWKEQDIWDYINKFNVNYSKIYDMGYMRTGCMFCGFGVHLEEHPNKFELMKETHPKQYDYCMNKLGLKDVLDYIIEHTKHKDLY